jgi:hypothetical protein
MSNPIPIQGRTVVLLQYPPPRRSATPQDVLDGFQWVKQFLFVDRVPTEESSQFDSPYRLRLYDSKPKSEKQFQSYRASLSIKDVQISVFPTLKTLFDTMVEWKPAPVPDSSVFNSNLALAVITHNRRWIFSVKEGELLELLDLFRSISPATCADADLATRSKDGLVDEVPVDYTPDPGHDTYKSFPEQADSPIGNSPASTVSHRTPVKSPKPLLLDEDVQLPTTSDPVPSPPPSSDLINSPHPTQPTSLQPISPSQSTSPLLSSQSFLAPPNPAEVDNPTAGLADVMFSDHFSLGAPPTRPRSSSRPHSSSQKSTELTDPILVVNHPNDLIHTFDDGNNEDVSHISSSLITSKKVDSFQRVFNLPNDELLFHCQCSFSKSILLHGRIYVSDRHLCFYSSIFGYRTKLKIDVMDITRVEPTTVAAVFGGGLKVMLTNGDLLIFGSLPGSSKSRLIATLERVGEHINTHLRTNSQPTTTVLPSLPESVLVAAPPPDVGEHGEDSDDSQPVCTFPLYDTIPYTAGPPTPQPAMYVSIGSTELASPVIDNFIINCSFSQLWETFLSNTSVHGFPKFYQNVRKEQNIRISQWHQYTPDSDKSTDPLNPLAGASEYLIRQVAFNSALNAPMGPPRVDILKRQVCALFKKDNKVVGMKLIGISATPDAPFGKEFFVCELFNFVPVGNGEKLTASLKMGAYFPAAIGWGLKMIAGTLKSRVKSDGTGQHQEWFEFINSTIGSQPKSISSFKENFSLVSVIKKKDVSKVTGPLTSVPAVIESPSVVTISPPTAVLGPSSFPIFTIVSAVFVSTFLLISNCTHLLQTDRAISLSILFTVLAILFKLESKN